jgi:hypothetical protein
VNRFGGGVLAALMLGSLACGKKGPPLPPLINLPAAPAEFTASRRAGEVELQFGVPGANLDGSKPADLARVEVYAMNGPASLPLDDVVRHGTAIGSVDVRLPPDPDADNGGSRKAAPRDDSTAGVDQGSVATLAVPLAVDQSDADAEDVRSYVAVGVNKRGRRGALSRRALVSLAPTPPAPAAPTTTYDEKAITLTWLPPPDPPASVAYNVYWLGERETKRTEQPQRETQFVDQQPIEWGVERCYAVRTVAIVGDLKLESEPSAPACLTPKDTFAPAPPTGLQAIASDAAVNLIWDANTESDLAGYFVLRAIAPTTELVSVTPTPIEQATFADTVPSGSRVTYAVQAVDKSGNVSPPSAHVVETAR